MTGSRFGSVLSSRPWRFAMLALVVFLVFSEARLLTLALLIVFLFVAAVHSRKNSSWFLTVLIAVCCAGILLHIVSMIDAGRVRDYIAEHTPPDPADAKDGTHSGTGQGPRGPTRVDVTLRDGKILDIRIAEYLDALSIDRESIEVVRSAILARNSLDLNADLIDRTPAVRGFYDAVCSALWAADPGFRGVSSFAGMTYFFTGHHLSRFALNALAVVFIVFLIFDYALQSILKPGTGQSLVCYNCQTCVGACPVKTVEGEPYPMTMVLETRLGNYSRVVELAHYCVGCGRCAGKCPAGISAPRIAAAAVSLIAQEKRNLKVGGPGAAVPDGG